MVNTVGLITYHYPHLKTEQVLQRLLGKKFSLKFYALPFSARTPRETLLVHRPNQSKAIHPEVLAKKHGIPYIVCSDDTDIDDRCDVYLVLGAGILSADCVAGKKVINCHPGIIPASRGLDSFKWAIYEMNPLGITLHYIDEEVDSGEIISVIPTDVYSSDSLATLSRRHYENEIDCLCRFDEFLADPENPFSDIEVGKARRRMPLNVEKELADKFADYLKIYNA